MRSRFFFALHLAVTLLAWVAPLLLSWKILVPIYALVLLQFAVFKRCLMNEQHGLPEQDDRIFYTDLLEKIGFQPNRQIVKTVVRRYLYPLLAIGAIIWQVLLAHPPLLM